MYQILITLFIISIIPASAAGPSFDCKKAGSQVEIAICKSTELMTLDLELSELYKSKKSTEEKTIQQTWVKNRNQKCSGTDIETCLKEQYTARITQLKGPAQTSFISSDPWKLIPPEQEKDYFSPELVADPGNPNRAVLRGISKEDRMLLIAVFEKTPAGFKRLGWTLDDLMKDVAPEEAILSSSGLNPDFVNVNAEHTVYAVNVGFTFDSTSTHCGTDKLAFFAIRGEDLVNVFEQILHFSCNGEKKERSHVTVDSAETKGFKDLLVTTGKKVQRYKWNGETYSK